MVNTEQPELDSQATSPLSVQVGQAAPKFDLPALQGMRVQLDQYQGQRNILLWFSRGFTCNFCRPHMDDMTRHYDAWQAIDTDIVQLAPNLNSAALRFFRDVVPPYPFICDPDKRLYAIYGLGDRGVLEATRNTVVSFSTAFMQGDGTQTVRGSWLDVMNRNFMRRLHHHAMTAVEQGVFIIDKQGIIRYRNTMGAIDDIPSATELIELTQALCAN